LDIKEKEIPNIQFFQIVLRANRVFDSINRVGLNLQEYTAEELVKYVPQTAAGKKAKLSFLRMIDDLDIDHDETNRQIFNDFESLITKEKELANGKRDSAENYRTNITGDDENDFTTRHYGNTDVMGETALHGTHVSGIIAAKFIDTGACGVAPFVKIMSVRCVPDGDEHDKDIALAVFYAVDNGAKVINMSFGKGTSPHKAWVDSAFKYAALHDVLLVHAAGNDSKNIDSDEEYPKPEMLDKSILPNMITVGASGDSSLNCGMLADFTNYGTKAVDVLAPGVKIYSTLPNNMFGFEQGTSMAAPIVSGLAALIRGYFPRLTAVQTKQIIEESVDKSMANQSFKKPGGEKKEKIKMRDVCKTGGIVNAYNAVLLAEKFTAQLPPQPVIMIKSQVQNNMNLVPKGKSKLVNR
jgi:cell wall-associated protease